jgi:hypothetical protein
MPQEFTSRLVYNVLNLVTNAAGFAASVRFGTNAYDVDPALGSTAMPGFTEFAGFYSRFRTMAIGYEFSLANQEAFPLSIVHGFSNDVIASGSFGLPYAGNPLMHSTMVGPLTGLNLKTLRGHKTVTAITGTQQPLFDDLYSGSTTSSTLPTASTKWCYCAFLSSAPFTAAGVLVTCRITLTVKFYLPRALLA